MKKYKIILVIMLIITLLIGFIIMIKSIEIETDTTTQIHNYLEKINTTYEVELIQNQIIEDSKLQMGKTYISKLVEYINFLYNFNYTGTEQIQYSLTANLIVEYQNANIVSDPVVLKRNYILIPITSAGEDKKINEEISIDFRYYREELKKIEEIISIPVNSYIELKFEVKDTSSVYTNIHKIPLNQDVFSITDDNNETNITQVKNKLKINEIEFIIGLILSLGSIALIVMVLTKNKSYTQMNYYAIKKAKILSSYGDIIVEMAETIDTKNLQVKNVKNFDQLVDIELEIRKPIIFYETIPEEEGEFLIIQDNIAYRYVLKNVKSKYKYKRKI